MSIRGVKVVGALLVGLLLATAASLPADDVAKLGQKYQQFLEEVRLLMTKPERQQFLALQKDYQREEFIYRFWEARNPKPGSSFNEFRRTWEGRVADAREQYGNLTEDRARMLLLHGAPREVWKDDCQMILWPLEVWKMAMGDNVPTGSVLLFYQPMGGGPYKLWHKEDGVGALVATRGSTEMISGDDVAGFYKFLQRWCSSSASQIAYAFDAARTEDAQHLQDGLEGAPRARDAEWVEGFRSDSTSLPAHAQLLDAAFDVAYPARDRGRTVVEGMVKVDPSAAQSVELEGHHSYNFLLTGEVLKESDLVERFRYRFDLPVGADKAALPLAFQRSLWPGDYLLVLRVEDTHSHHNYRLEQPLTVPENAALPELAATIHSPDVAAVLAQAHAEVQSTADNTVPLASNTPTAQLVPPEAPVQVGAFRLSATIAGTTVHHVTFYLDGKEMLTRLRAPYTVELSLEDTPTPHRVRVAAYDVAGIELASDSLLLNPPKQRFGIELLSPRSGTKVKGAVEARADVRVPDGSKLDRVEFYLGASRVATLYQAPWTQVMTLPPSGAPFVRAVAYLTSGVTTEDLAVINSADVVERLDVRLIELYAAVLDPEGHPAGNLVESDFAVVDGGQKQALLRFEHVRDLPLHVMLMLDTSASMAKIMPTVQKAALGFLHRTLEPKDQAALLTFSDNPILRMPFTSDLDALAGRLAGLDAERGTALYDSVVYGLSYMRGAERGQSALVLFTDGGDHLSNLRFEDVLSFAQRSGVTVYVIGSGVSILDLGARGNLVKLAAATGGRTFFPSTAAEIDAAYAMIEQELRARYLLAYQPTKPPHEGEYRPVEVKVAKAGWVVKTAPGYMP
jgi:Ca-activated chloride channel family protein